MQDLAPLLMTVLMLVLLLGVVTFVANVQPMKVLVVAAARNCARAGVETLAQGRGEAQASATAEETAGLAVPEGLPFDPQALAVDARVEDEVWGRGRVFVCETGFNVRVDHIPLVGWFYAGEYVPLRSRVSLSIEPYKARWGEE